MKYKYIGTEEQLVQHGFYKDDDYEKWAEITSYDKQIDGAEDPGDTVTIFTTGAMKNRNKFVFNMSSRHTEDISIYIQDLIEAGLVEVIK